MKKLIISLGLMFAATFALTNCAKNDEPTDAPVLNGPKYELFAAPADTRTTNDGLATKWAEKDSINVFHAATGTNVYKDDDGFAIADIATGRFTGTLSETLTEGTQYDWYLLYPYESFITTPDNTTGYLYIGGRTDKNQQQSGNNSMAHIAGANYCPMYAKATVTYPDPISVTMNHLASVIAVNVTNDDEEAITVTGVSFTATEDIVGQFYINIAGENPTYTSAKYADTTANLTVSDGTPLAKGESAKFYMLIKPFTAASGSTLSLTLKTDKGNCTKELPLTSDVAFTAGKIKTLNIGFEAAPAEDYSGTYIILAPITNGNYWYLSSEVDGNRLKAIDSTVSAITDETTIADFANVDEKYVWIIEKSGANYKIKSQSITDNAKYLGGAATGKTNNLKLVTESSAEIVKIEKDADNNYTIATTSLETTKYIARNSTSNNPFWAFYASQSNSLKLIPYVVTPTIIAEDIKDVPAAGVTDETAAITLKGLDGVTVNATADGTVVTAASVEGNTLTYTVSANETSEAREGSITLSAEGAANVTIKVAQLAKEAVTLTLTPDTDITLEATDTEAYENAIKITSDATDITVGAFDNIDGTTESTWLYVDRNTADNNMIDYSAIEANTGAERVAYIVVTATLDGNSITKTVKVTQKAAGAGTEQVIYSTEFNYDVSGPTYNSSKEITGTDSDGKQWGIVYGNWNNSSCAQLRVYKSGGGFGSVYTKFDLAKVTKVSYKAKVSDTALNLNTYYSTDGGSTWIAVNSNLALTKTLVEYTFSVSTTGEYDNVRIKFEVAGSRPSNGNIQLTIDDVSIYGIQ